MWIGRLKILDSGTTLICAKVTVIAPRVRSSRGYWEVEIALALGLSSLCSFVPLPTRSDTAPGQNRATIRE